MSIEFTNPLALILLALIPAALYFARHSLANLTGGRARASIIVRALLLLLIVLALAGLRIRTTSRDIALIFLVDVSSSVAQDQQRGVVDFINREIERAGPRDYLGVIAFGREAAVELAPTRKEILGDWRLAEISSNPPRDYTNIAAAMRLAAALVPDGAAGRLVLISDGNENLESALEESRLLRADAVEVHTQRIGTVSDRGAGQAEIAVRDLATPQMLSEGEAFDLRVTVDSTRDSDAVLRVFRNDSVVAERDVRLTGSGENVFVLPQRVEQKGFYTYRAEIEAVGSDLFVQNNSRDTFAIIEGRPKTLYLHGDPQPSPAVARVLAEGGFAATIRNQDAAPTALAGFNDYDLVIFDNVPALALTREQMKMVQSYVRDLGGGFIMIGGDQSFGPGGYYKTPVEETLPVSLDVRQKKHFPSLAIALVIDRSGSMSGTKMQLALEAAAATVDFLSERDAVTVIAFDSQAHSIVDLTKVQDKRAIQQKIAEIGAGGGTSMYPGLQMAFERLKASDAQIKHVITLSDGVSEPGDFPGIARAIREAGMTLTSVAVGADADTSLMQMLANVGGGRFYAAVEEDSLPRIFTREAFLASATTIIEEPFTPRLVRPTQATSGIDWGAAPQLGGYVGTAERDALSSPAITSLISDKDDPVYAVWQYGLGRAAAFTSDAKPQWAANWMNWPGFGQFWTQMLRDAIRRQGATDLVPRVEINAGKGRITVEATTPDGAFINNLRLRAHVVAPDFTANDIALEQTAAGRYEGEFPAVARGAYLVSVNEEGGRTAPVTGAVNSYSPEFVITSGDANLLAAISEATGGQVVTETGEANLFERRTAKTEPREIWQTLLLMGLLLLPFDVGIRRLHITREQRAQARAWIAAKLRRPVAAEVEAEASPQLAQLKVSRSRVRLTDGDAAPVEVKPVSHPAAREKEPASAPPAAEPASPLASRLLDARRKKQE